EPSAATASVSARKRLPEKRARRARCCSFSAAQSAPGASVSAPAGGVEAVVAGATARTNGRAHESIPYSFRREGRPFAGVNKKAQSAFVSTQIFLREKTRHAEVRIAPVSNAATEGETTNATSQLRRHLAGMKHLALVVAVLAACKSTAAEQQAAAPSGAT